MFLHSRTNTYRTPRMRSLQWLLLLSLLLQSLGPTTLAAAASPPVSAFSAQADTRGTDTKRSGSGIWTISCAGKPMWLPFPGQGADTGTAALADHTTRVCFFCNNGFCNNGAIDPALLHCAYGTGWTTAASYNCMPGITTAANNPVRQLYRPRGPPSFHTNNR